MLSPYFVNLVTFDIILVLLIFSGKVKTQLKCSGKMCRSFPIKTLKDLLKSVYI